MAEQDEFPLSPRRNLAASSIETAAHESEQRLRVALAAGGVGTWRFDFTQNRGTASARTWEIFGRAGQDTLTIDEWTAAIHPEDRAMAQAAFAQAAASGQFNMDYRIALLDGAVRWVGVAGSLNRDAAGNPVTLDGIITDITERKLREKQQTFLLKLSDALRPLGDAEEIKLTALNIIGQHLNLSRIFYGEMTEDNLYLIVDHNYVSGHEREIVGRFRVNDFGPALVEMLNAGRVVRIPDIASAEMLSAEERKAYFDLGIHAIAGVPLVKAGRFAAILNLHQSIPRVWTDDEIRLVEEVAERTWAAVERARAEEALRTNEARMRYQKEAFQTAVNGAALSHSLGIIADLVHAELHGEARTAFYIADASGELLHPVWGAGNMPESYLKQIDGFAIGEDSLACGLAVPTGRPVVTRDVFDEPLWEPWVHVAAQHDFRGCWSFPIKTRDSKAVGTLALYFQEPRDATPRELALADIVTQTAAVIIASQMEAQERARAETALKVLNEQLDQRVVERTESLQKAQEQMRELSTHMEMTRENERVRIAREVHDELGGALTVLKIDMGLLAWGRGDDAGYMARMDDLKAQLDNIVQIVRRIGSDLRPPVLDDLGLLPALEWHAREFQKRTGIACQLDLIEDEPALTREQRTAVYRVFQEALTNVARHAHATGVIATMGIDEGELILVLEDNGIGIRPEQLASAQSLGLKGMQERMKEVGGAVEIEGEAGHGTVVVIRVPVLAA